MIRILTVMAVGLALTLSGAIGVAQKEPTEDRAVVRVDTTQRPSGDIESQVAALEAQVEAQPRDGRTWATLAHVYVERARLNGDPSNYDRADRALRKAFALNGRDDTVNRDIVMMDNFIYGEPQPVQ